MAEHRIAQEVAGIARFSRGGFVPHVADSLGVQADLILEHNLPDGTNTKATVHDFIPHDVLQLFGRALHEPAALQRKIGLKPL